MLPRRRCHDRPADALLTARCYLHTDLAGDSTSGQRLRLAVERAARREASLREPRVSPHTIRHTTAMHLLQSGVDLSVIAMWLGHESVQTTHQYLDADLESKRRALRRLKAPTARGRKGQSPGSLMKFLGSL